MSLFEYDQNKSKINFSKHGIDFETAQLLWQDAKSTDEPRSLMIGLINGKHWSAVITYRNKYIRLIKRSLSKKVTV